MFCVLTGKVYDVTRFLKYHPGRKAQLMRGAGVDCTGLYDKVHVLSYILYLISVFSVFFTLALFPGDSAVDQAMARHLCLTANYCLTSLLLWDVRRVTTCSVTAMLVT